MKDITNAFNAETRKRIFRWKAKDITAFRAKHNIAWRARRNVVAQRLKAIFKRDETRRGTLAIMYGITHLFLATSPKYQ